MNTSCAAPSNPPSSAAKIDAVERALGPNAPVERRETSMAWVFLTADRAYKMKKPIRRRIFDFSTTDLRRHACSEELRLNRRLAPDVYLGLSQLKRALGGVLSLDGEGETVEWLVRMRRLPDARFLDRALANGAVTEADIIAIARRLTRFHQSLPPEVPSSNEYLSRFQSDLEETRSFLPKKSFADEASRFERLTALLASVLAMEPGLLLTRLTDRRVVEGHGDLRPEHVWLGPPVLIIDCLEAARGLRLLDPFEEYATLAMECATIDEDWVGKLLFREATKRMDDRPDARLSAFYTAHRATLRARQALAHLLDPTPRTPAKWRPLARRYLVEAERAAAILETTGAPRANRHDGAAGSPRRKAGPR
ncbi:hypothetical protein DEA8626_02350 [Defluviimonas aquaemixtae]|uniref:Aminoglycoside phosphotransferase domain-containing protein n=2 Tax=Albidovulum aquaemixtae TaxID=1542388 RepID=A0A2R8B810_9RHOB|nr:hypothetical protein DEA8626_02350 [Defluviimonas aquaemixtae]